MSSEDEIRRMKQQQQAIQKLMDQRRSELSESQRLSEENHERSEQTGSQTEQQTQQKRHYKEE